MSASRKAFDAFPRGSLARLLPFLLSFLTVFAAARAEILLDTRYQYDAAGNLTAVTDGAGQTARIAWDPLGRPSSETNPLNQSTAYRYQPNDAIDRVQAPNGAVTTWSNDGFGQARAEASPDRGATGYIYDAAGNLTQSTDARGARVETAYDALDRPVERRFYRPDQTLEATHLYTWDRAPRGIGRLDRIDAGPNQLAFDYDLAGHTTTRAYTRGAVALAVRADHDPATGLLDTLTYPSGGVIQYRYDAAGRVSELAWDGQAIADQLQYTAFGAVAALRLANGLDHRRSYDTAGRIKSYTLAGETVQIGYDAAGRITVLTPADPSRLQQFGYDAAGRLTGYQGQAHTESYAYDANGNRLTRTQNGSLTPYQYTPNSNRLQTLNALAIGHDAAGNRTLDLTRQYTHDSTGRLIQLQQGTTLARYEYNGLGERTLKQVGTDLRHFVYDEQGLLLGEYGAQGQPLVEYAWLGDLPIAYRVYRNVNGLTQIELYTMEADHLGTPRVLTDDAQRLRWRWFSAPFGDTAAKENPQGLGALTFNLRFPGQYYDEESGLHYNTFRDYDPGTGRYVQSDPIGLEGGINTYLYARGNPVLYIDPLGLDNGACVNFCTVAGGVIGGFVGRGAGGVIGGAVGGAGGTLVGGPPGGVIGGTAGAAAGAQAGGAAGAAAGATAGNAAGQAMCPDDDDPQCSMATPYQLLQAEITDEHEFKEDYVGKKKGSRYDICACKDGSIKIAGRKQCGNKGPKIDTYARWK